MSDLNALFYAAAHHTTAINIANLSLETLEALTVLGVVYLTLVWSLSWGIRKLETKLALPEAR